jgi:hypothetical protein
LLANAAFRTMIPPADGGGFLGGYEYRPLNFRKCGAK